MITIVTPSRNQGAFLETAIESVLTQGVDVEYVVVDGASTDGSVDVIERHADRIARWVSEPDAGQYDALNKGFAGTSGEIMGWLNADDFYFPGCLAAVEHIFARFPQVEWITGTIIAIANAAGHVVRLMLQPRVTRAAFYRGFNLPLAGWHAGHFVAQESTFWRRSLWERSGGAVDSSRALAGDFELWGRFLREAEPWGARVLLGCYRSHPAQKTAVALAQYRAEAEAALRDLGGSPYGGRESAARQRLGRAVSGVRLWRLPGPARDALEARGLIYRMPELIWDDAAGDWKVGHEYFV